MANGFDTTFESDGLALHVDLLYTVTNNQLIYVDGWLGIAQEDGVSGDMIALNVDRREYQLIVPTSVALEKGDILYITVANVTGHTLNDNAYSKTSGAGKVAFFKCTMDQDLDTGLVTGIMLPPFAS